MYQPNFNIGILGHVDCGKTTLAKALSHTASTACFDKNPQSKERGITLDLGFSSFTIPYPSQLGSGPETLLVTLVDCPGHASLLKTVIGGAHIIDMMILVIDVNKGLQTQTAECLIIGELTCDKLLVVLNKIDLIPLDKRISKIEKMRKKIRATLAQTKFKEAPIIYTSAAEKEGVEDLISTISEYISMPTRNSNGPFVFAVDHCFGIKGQGTVLTGTCLSGTIKINDSVQISDLKLNRKVKSLQVFKKSVSTIYQGDRAGICVTQFDPKLLERGLVYTDGAVRTGYAAVIDINKVPYYKGTVSNGMKYHVSIGHETILAKITFFRLESNSNKFCFDQEFMFLETYDEDHQCFALLDFEYPIMCVPESIVIISRLDMDINTPSCRLAFNGTLQHIFTSPDYQNDSLSALKIFKNKEREGVVERMNDCYNVIGRELFKKETNIDLFCNLNVTLSTGEIGQIEGSFGQSGKFKVYFPDGLNENTINILSLKKKCKGQRNDAVSEKISIKLVFKRFLYDKSKAMVQ